MDGNMDHRILVTGASGNIGSKIAGFLHQKNASLRLVARTPEKLLAFPNAEKVVADYADIASLDKAFAGIEKAFIVSGSQEPHKRALLHKNAFEAAKRAGVSYVIYLSFLGASPTSLFPMSQDHFESQQYLAATGLPYTALQDSFYAELAPTLFNKDGRMKAPAGNGEVSWVGRDEVAEAVSKLLLADRSRLGVYPMTGSKSYSMPETASVLSRITGRPFQFENETVAEAKASRAALTSRAWEVDVWVGSYLAIGAGEVAAVTSDLGDLLERPASDLETYLRQRAKA